jgi:hypothetical protein
MAFVIGDKVQARYDLKEARMMGAEVVREGTPGQVTRIDETWFGFGSTRYVVRFDTGVVLEALTPEQIEHKHGWF